MLLLFIWRTISHQFNGFYCTSQCESVNTLFFCEHLYQLLITQFICSLCQCGSLRTLNDVMDFVMSLTSYALKVKNICCN